MIDDVDYTILKCLQDAEEAFWKKRIYQEMEERHEVLPLPNQVSLQTVSRHIDKLYDADYLENTIVSPDDLPRDLIIGYTLTDAGEKVVERKRETLLREIVSKELFSDGEDTTVGQKALAELVNNEFGLRSRTVKTAEYYSRDELLTLLGTYFLQKKASRTFGENDIQRFRDVIADQQSPSVIL